jgi:hypothetical protein
MVQGTITHSIINILSDCYLTYIIDGLDFVLGINERSNCDYMIVTKNNY